MEVFMQGLSDSGDLNSKGLRTQLEPVMRALNISPQCWDCEKPPSKKFGFITFSLVPDAEKFLSRHGQIMQRPGHILPRLMILGTNVFCRCSSKPANPGILKTLQTRRNNDARQSSAPASREGSQQRNDTGFQVTDLDCGHYMFLDEVLTFVPEVNLYPGRENLRAVAFAKFTRKNIILKFGLNQIRIPFNTVIELVWSPAGHISVLLNAVPQFLVTEAPTVQQLMRRLDISRGTPQGKMDRVTSLNSEHASIVGVCLVYRFSVGPSGLAHKIRDMEAKRVFEVTRHDVPVRRVGNMNESLNKLMRGLRALFTSQSLPFDILFQLQSLALSAYLHPDTLLEVAQELARLRKAPSNTGNGVISMEAVKKLFTTPYPSPYEDPEIFSTEAIVSYLKEMETQIRKEKYYADMTSSSNTLTKIYRVTVTPSRITLHGPELDNQNRVLRKFPNNHDCFIRVQFSEENGQDVRFNSRINTASIYDRFRHILERGIEVAGRTYTFLGWSHSSLRSHSIWFCAPFIDETGALQTYFTIIKDLGNFTSIQSPARCAARIGQAFSETPFAVPLDDNDIAVYEIPDIKSRDGSRVFSDGVGKISLSALRIAWRYLPQDTHVSPTVLQIRWAGCKGLLALDTGLVGTEMRIRPSMQKFESDEDKNLEICSDTASKPIPLVLNRQMIKILEDMGVPDSFFFALQDLELAHLQSITSNPINTGKFLRRQAIGATIKLPKLVREIYKLGLDYRKDDFLRRVVETVVLKELRLLKHKARIPVQQGVTLFGIVDETGYLEEREVFVTYDQRYGKGVLEPPPRGGLVIVTRSPALHPGDIQLVQNATPPVNHPLRALKNCVVFSSKGSRDLPSQLSGGDLDGDIYNVIWDTRATYTPNGAPMRTFVPADYPRVPAVDIGRPVKKEDMAEFFVNFMKTDQLGVIATRHIIIADQHPDGTLAPDCITLAGLHSTAVDFSKTGIPVDFRKLPRSNRARPDFMAPGPVVHLHDKGDIELQELVVQEVDDVDDDDGPGFEYYRSDKILGKLYRAIDESLIWREDIHLAKEDVGPPFWTSFVAIMMARASRALGVPLGEIDWRGKMETARMIRSAYDDAIFGSMTHYAENPLKPLTEMEVFIGAIINSSGSQTHRQRDKSQKLQDEFGRISKWITAQMRQGSDLPLTGYAKETDCLELCLACLFISTSDANDAPRRGRRAREGTGEMQSFSLVAASAVLAELEHLGA